MSFELINFYNNLRITTEELLSIIPEDEQERKYFFVHMSVFDTFKFVGLLTKICSQLNFINYAKIQYEMKLDDFFMERKIDAPLIKLYEQLELYSITVNNKSRREYNSD
ncbi:MAG: hypothetical protein KBT06_11130, partial [Prevotellaceae bacterium]|nr:hypothetical protein [Candidatus Colivivens equi]